MTEKQWKEIVKKSEEAKPATGTCQHCGAPMVDGMCDAPLSNAD